MLGSRRMHTSLHQSISDMTEDTIYKEDNNDDRFRILEHMFIVIGTPLFPVRGSRLYSVYRIVVYFSLCFTFVTIIIGIMKNFEDMDYVMESARPGLAIFNVLWTDFFMRYQPVSSRLSFKTDNPKLALLLLLQSPRPCQWRSLVGRDGSSLTLNTCANASFMCYPVVVQTLRSACYPFKGFQT
jgi:hypothetical protein